MASRFTVYTYDRRGRGGSGDTLPYAVEREVEDLAALVEETGGSASVYGISSGAALALEAANGNVSIDRLVLYEAPFVVDGTRPPVSDEYVERIDRLAATDRGARHRTLDGQTHMVKPAALAPVLVELLTTAERHQLP